MRTSVGYTGGANPHPSYKTVCNDDGHTEAVRVEYNPDEISYQDLLDKYWSSFVGPGGKAQYKAAIWCEDDEALELAQKSLKAVQVSGNFMPFMVRDEAITIEKMHPWHEAEEYHQHHLYGRPAKQGENKY